MEIERIYTCKSKKMICYVDGGKKSEKTFYRKYTYRINADASSYSFRRANFGYVLAI